MLHRSSALRPPTAYLHRAARGEVLWQMHTAVPLGSDQPIDPRRNSFEISVSDKFAQLLATARDDLARAESPP